MRLDPENGLLAFLNRPAGPDLVKLGILNWPVISRSLYERAKRVCQALSLVWMMLGYVVHFPAILRLNIKPADAVGLHAGSPALDDQSPTRRAQSPSHRIIEVHSGAGIRTY